MRRRFGEQRDHAALNPGAYTLQVSGGATTGQALAEVYEIP